MNMNILGTINSVNIGYKGNKTQYIFYYSSSYNLNNFLLNLKITKTKKKNTILIYISNVSPVNGCDFIPTLGVC